MLATRQLVPSSVTHLACSLLLEGGNTALLSAVASSLHIRLPVWKTDSDGNVSCVFTPTKDELHIGTVAVALVPCAYQCFMVITQDCELLVGRYQANLPAPSNSWLVNDSLHHNNTWLILYRGKLPGHGIVNHLVPNSRLLFAVGVSGTVVECSITRGLRHTASIDIPENVSGTFFCEKWVFNTSQGVGPYSYGVAPFRRDVVEQSDEELLTQCTVAELAQRKRLRCPPAAASSSASLPVRVTLRFQALGDHMFSMTSLPAPVHPRRHDRFVFVFSNLLNVYDGSCYSLRGAPLTSFSVGGSLYLALDLPGRLLILSVVDGVHVLSTLSVDPISRNVTLNMTSNYGKMRLARGLQRPLAGVVVQHGGAEEVLWLLLSDGFLTEVSIGELQLCDKFPVTLDAPGIQSGDCEDGEWVTVHISGLPRDFRAVSLVPFWRGRVEEFQPYAVTKRYALLSDGVSDTYLVDLVERRAVGSLSSHGAMTATCDGPEMDLIVAYSKGMLQRISPGVRSPARVHAAFSGVHQMFALPHMKCTHSTTLVFHFLVTTATRSFFCRGTIDHLEMLQESEAFVLDEPTLAVHSATESTDSQGEGQGMMSSSLFLRFAQCTPTCINLAGLRIPFSHILPKLSSVSHARFAGDAFVAVANCQHVVIFSIINRDTVRVYLEEDLLADVSHLTAWRTRESGRWAVAACLWSHKVVVWLVGVGSTRRHELAINDVVASSFPLPDGGVGLTFMNCRMAAMYNNTAEDLPIITEMMDVGNKMLRAECCLPVTTHGAIAANHHFDLVALYNGRVELVALGSSGVVEEQLGVALGTPLLGTAGISDNGVAGHGHTDVVGRTTLRCGFVLYLPDASFYLLVLYDGSGIIVWSVPELLSSSATNAGHSRRRSALLRGPVTYQVTHALQLPFITAHDHRLTRAVYLPLSNTIVTLTDRGEKTSFVTAIDAEAFRMIDGLPMSAKEIPTCIESFSVFEADVAVIGTAQQSADVDTDPTSGRLLVVQVRPLRISATACITTGGVLDISVQGHGDDHLIAVAGMKHVLVYRLAGLTLSLVCSAENKSVCTTVALRYPFLSCGLYMWGTHYMQLLPPGTEDDGDTVGRSGGNTASDGRLAAHHGDECAPWSRWGGTAFTLKICALEPTAFSAVHSQTVYGEDFARIDAERNVMTVTFRDPAGLVADEMPETRVVGVEGGYSGVLTRCLRLPSLPLQIRRSEQGRAPWRHRSAPFVSWCGRPTALRLVGTALLLPCADGSLHCAAEIPHAFVSPLLRLEQRVTELYDTTMALSWPECGAGGGLHRTYHSVSFEAGNAVQCATRVLPRQSFLCVDAIEEYFLLTRLAEMPDPLLTGEERTMIARKKRLMDEYLRPVWEEYGGELRDVDVGDMLHLW